MRDRIAHRFTARGQFPRRDRGGCRWILAAGSPAALHFRSIQTAAHESQPSERSIFELGVLVDHAVAHETRSLGDLLRADVLRMREQHDLLNTVLVEHPLGDNRE
jgi:hypothetical protein